MENIFRTKRIKNHAYLDTQGYKIVSIYGGSEISAAIDECGSIHIIDPSIFNDKKFCTHVT